MYQAFNEMPPLLRLITMHALACFLFFIAAVIPGIPIGFNGEVMKSQELWANSLGLPAVAIGLAMPLMGVLFLRRWKYCRQFYSVILVAVTIVPYVIWQQLIAIIFGVVLSCAIIGYLFMNRRARTYFSS